MKPLSGDEILGHESTLASLAGAAAHDRLGHALLFSGPEGVGKRQVALALAKRLLGGDDAERFDRLAHEGLLVFTDAEAPIPVRRADVLDKTLTEEQLVAAYECLEAEGWIRGFASSASLRGPRVVDLLDREPDRFLGRRNIPFAEVLEKELATLEKSRKADPNAAKVARKLFAPGVSEALYRRNLGIELINGRGDGSYFRSVDSMLRVSRGAARRVIIIDDAHKLTEEAENAFLKSLEEPPAGTHFILVTSEPLSLLPTTLSRCAQIVFHSHPAERIARWLRDTGQAPELQIELLATLAEGSFASTLRLRGQGLVERRRALEDVFPGIVSGDLRRVLSSVGKRFASAGESSDGARDPLRLEARLFLEFLGLSFRDLVLLSSDPSVEPASGLDREHLLRWSSAYPVEVWDRFFMRTEIAAQDIASNVEPRLAVEALFAEAFPTHAGVRS